MKSVLMSIKPKYCELIASGKKTIEVRKSKPKLQTPFKCYIYECLGKRLYNDYFDNEGCGKVIGEFVCDNVEAIAYAENGHIHIKEKGTCLSIQDLTEYYEGSKLYGWHISNLKIYAEPKKLSEFKKYNRECWYANLGLAKRDCPECQNKQCFLTRPPQSWCYVEV